jgi:ubiquinone biosynthesis monooxygenase Coq7
MNSATGYENSTFDELCAIGLDAQTIRDLRSDHAGEVGAVAIYRGILAVTRNNELRGFADEHLETERRHLSFFEQLLPRAEHTRLVLLWRIAGFLTGALPALFGVRAVFVTIEAVERFVDAHYQQQVASLEGKPQLAALRNQLEAFRRDEVRHGEDAGSRYHARVGLVGRTWQRMVGGGSKIGVALARLR